MRWDRALGFFPHCTQRVDATGWTDWLHSYVEIAPEQISIGGSIRLNFVIFQCPCVFGPLKLLQVGKAGVWTRASMRSHKKVGNYYGHSHNQRCQHDGPIKPSKSRPPFHLAHNTHIGATKSSFCAIFQARLVFPCKRIGVDPW